MGGSEEEAGSSHQKKMDESEGMCRDDANYKSCWGRICNPNRGHVLKDILRGLLVLIVLAIVITVIFLLCYFLLNDIEKKEDEVIDNLVKDFSAGGPLHPNPEILTKDINQNSPSDTELYDSGPLRGDVGKEKEEIRAENPNNIDLRTPEVGKFPAVTVFAPSSPSLGNNGENVKVVKPPFLIPEVHATTEEVPEESILFPEVPGEQQGFIPVRTSPPGGNEGLLDFNFNQDVDGQNFDNFSDFVVAESGSDCVPLRLPLCSTMPWTLTAFPNWVNNNNMRELQESLKYFQSTIIGGRCSAKATEYSCAILEPACGPDGISLPPCKAFCEDISRTCSEYLTNENKHRIALQCDRFPDSKNPNVCVDVNGASSETSDTKMTDMNAAFPQETTFHRQDVNQPQFKDYPNVPGSPSNDDYISDAYDEIIGREDLLPSTSIDSSTPDIAKIIDFADIPKESKKIPEMKQFTPDKVATEKIANEEFETISEDVQPSDNETTELPVFICDHTKFLCEDGSDCLPPEAVCDGTQNCLDNSDEANCTAPDCKDDSFACISTSYCIPRSWMCDGTDDCKDNSDELNCPTNSTANFDDFANTRDDDNLVAASSDLLPGVFGVIDHDAGNSAGPSNILNNDGSSPPDKDVSLSSRLPEPFNANYPPEDDVTAEILSQFPKFGTESEPNFGFENVDKPKEGNTNEMGTVPSLTPQEEDAQGQMRRNRPDRFKISRPTTRFSIEKQESFEIRNPGLTERNPDAPLSEVQESGNIEPTENYVAETLKESENTAPVRKRQRPTDLRIPSRRINQGLRRPINSPDEAPTSLEESTSEPSIPIRRNKRPTTPSYELFRTRSTLPPVSSPGKRPTSIVMRRPTADSPQTPSLAEKVDEFLKESEPTDSQSLPSAAQPITIPKQILPQSLETGNVESKPNAPRRTRLRPSRPERPFLPNGKLSRERNQVRISSSSEPEDLLVEGSETAEEYVYPDVEPSESSRVDDNYNDDQNAPLQESDYYGQYGPDQLNYFQKEGIPEYPKTQEAYANDESSPNGGSAIDEFAYAQYSRKPATENQLPSYQQPEQTNFETKYPTDPAYTAAAANVPLYNYQLPNNRQFVNTRRNDYQSPYDNSPQNSYQNSEQPSADSENLDAESDVSPYYNTRNYQPQQTYLEVPNYSQQTYQRSNEPIYQYADPQSPHLPYRIQPNYRQAYPNSH